MTRSFDEDLTYSKCKEGALDRIYLNYFQNVTGISHIERIDEMTRQRAGIDTIVTLNSGETIRTQEKYRTREFTGDFLIEYCSVFKKGICEKPGWIYTIDADYLFAVYAPSQLVKIYPVVQLKIAFSNNKEKWISKYRIPPAKTIDRYTKEILYYTHNIAVPCEILEQEITKVMRFEYQQKLYNGE